jgi:hypothetical protein
VTIRKTGSAESAGTAAVEVEAGADLRRTASVGAWTEDDEAGLEEENVGADAD